MKGYPKFFIINHSFFSLFLSLFIFLSFNILYELGWGLTEDQELFHGCREPNDYVVLMWVEMPEQGLREGRRRDDGCAKGR